MVRALAAHAPVEPLAHPMRPRRTDWRPSDADPARDAYAVESQPVVSARISGVFRGGGEGAVYDVPSSAPRPVSPHRAPVVRSGRYTLAISGPSCGEGRHGGAVVRRPV